METVIYILGVDGDSLEIPGGSVPAVGEVVQSTAYPKGCRAVYGQWRVESIERGLVFGLVDGETRGPARVNVFVQLVPMEAPCSSPRPPTSDASTR